MNRFERDLQRCISGVMERWEKIHLGYPSVSLQQVGIPPYPIKLNQSIVRKVINKHGLSSAQLVEVQKGVNSPLMIFESNSLPGAKLLLTQTVHNSESLIVAIHKGQMGKNPTNEIRSIYPKATAIILLWIEKKLLLAADKQRSQQWLEDRARSNSARYLAIAGGVKSLISERQSQGGMKL